MSLINNELNQNNDNYFIEINSKSNFEINYEKNYTYLESTFIKKGLDAEIDISEAYNLINEYLNTIFTNVNFLSFHSHKLLTFITEELTFISIT